MEQTIICNSFEEKTNLLYKKWEWIERKETYNDNLSYLDYIKPQRIVLLQVGEPCSLELWIDQIWKIELVKIVERGDIDKGYRRTILDHYKLNIYDNSMKRECLLYKDDYEILLKRCLLYKIEENMIWEWPHRKLKDFNKDFNFKEHPNHSKRMSIRRIDYGLIEIWFPQVWRITIMKIEETTCFDVFTIEIGYNRFFEKWNLYRSCFDELLIACNKYID